jgi:spermidine synthase
MLICTHYLHYQMDLIENGWFHERNPILWPGQALSLEVKEMVFTGRSEFQDVLVFVRCISRLFSLTTNIFFFF